MRARRLLRVARNVALVVAFCLTIAVTGWLSLELLERSQGWPRWVFVLVVTAIPVTTGLIYAGLLRWVLYRSRVAEERRKSRGELPLDRR